MAKKRVSDEPAKNPAAVELGRRGGQARVAKGFSTMDPERRAEIARAAAKKRWKKPKTK
jgi:general stress protein YciG